MNALQGCGARLDGRTLPRAKGGAVVPGLRSEKPSREPKRRGDVWTEEREARTERRATREGIAFQALRIEVNRELDALASALPAALDALALGGRIVILAYHSLEDRLVKRTLAARAADTTPPGLPVPLEAARPEFRLLTRGAERPSAAEVAANPRAAPARLRAAERIKEAA